MTIVAFPIRRTTPMADATAIARRCAQFALHADNEGDMAALLVIAGRQGKRVLQLRVLQLRALGVRG